MDAGQERVSHPLTALAMLTFSSDAEDVIAHEVRQLTTERCSFRLNGTNVDVDGYLDHIRGLRAAMTSGDLRVVAELTDGGASPHRVAGRYVVHMQMHDGAIVRGESHLIGVLDSEHRIAHLYEIGRIIGDEDGALGTG